MIVMERMRFISITREKEKEKEKEKERLTGENSDGKDEEKGILSSTVGSSIRTKENMLNVTDFDM
jgi:hypothetical protein